MRSTVSSLLFILHMSNGERLKNKKQGQLPIKRPGSQGARGSTGVDHLTPDRRVSLGYKQVTHSFAVAATTALSLWAEILENWGHHLYSSRNYNF